MSKRTFWVGLAFAFGGVVLLPALIVGLVAIGHGLAVGSEGLLTAGVGMAGIALAVAGLLWWIVRRTRPRPDPAPSEGPAERD